MRAGLDFWEAAVVDGMEAEEFAAAVKSGECAEV